MAHINIQTLRTELLTDPFNLYGTDVANRNDSLVAAAINLARPSIQIRRADINSSDVINAIAVADYAALPANPNTTALSTERRFLSWLECIANTEKIRLLQDDGTDAPAIANFRAMFSPGGVNTPTFNRLIALAMRNGSRAEQLFGTDVIVDTQHVTDALSL